jgi:hypothetical protein
VSDKGAPPCAHSFKFHAGKTNFRLRQNLSLHKANVQGLLFKFTQLSMGNRPVLGNPSDNAISAGPEPSPSASDAASELQSVADAKIGLLLQLEELDTYTLTQLELKILELGLNSFPKCEADFQLAAQLRLQAVGAGDVSLETIAAPCASEGDTEAADRVQDAQTRLAYDCLYAEAVARFKDMDTDTERDHDMAYREEIITSERTIPCPMCLEQLAFSTTVVLGDCKHCFCFTCARKYVDNIGRKDVGFLVLCRRCGRNLKDSQCLAVLGRKAELHSTFENLISDETCMSWECYCPNAKCGQMFAWVGDLALAESPLRYRLICCVCWNASCAEFRDLWHQGRSCEAHRMECNDETGLAELALARQWKLCPQCGALIGKQIGDCNYVCCDRCGHDFSHACGVSYRTSIETANNGHGDPGCDCGLFPYDDGGGDDGDDVVGGGVLDNQIEIIYIEMPRDLLGAEKA